MPSVHTDATTVPIDAARDNHAAHDAGADSPEDDAGPTDRRPKLLRTIVPKPGQFLQGSDLTIACAGRRPCRLDSSKPAGRDAQGRVLTVVKISLWTKEQSTSMTHEERFGGRCEPFEHWLVTRDGKDAVSAELLLEICNDGYGAAGLGEDDVGIGPNRFSHTRNGGSNWRWSESVDVQLSPRRILEQSTSGYWTVGPNVDFRQWSWTRFSGRGEVYSPPCDSNGNPPDLPEPSPGTAPTEPGYAWFELPVVALDPVFVDHGWRTTRLGRCALLVDGTKEHGFVIHGTHRGPTDSVMRVLGSPDGAFFVEIEDDKFTGPSDKWLFDDHLEIWVGKTKPIDYGNHCEEPRKERPRQWGVRIADGAVFAGYGHPDPAAIRVEIATNGQSKMIKVVPPEGSITFVYSDSDDGKSQHAMVSTSRLVFGDILSLGAVKRILEGDAICQATDGTLDPVLR